MQPDLERLLRESRDALPGPEPATVRRAVERAFAGVERAARRRRVPLVGAIALGVVLVLALAAVAAERVIETRTAEAATRVLDRTLVCTTGFQGGLRLMYARASIRRPSSGMPTSASVNSGHGRDGMSVGLEAGPAPAGGRTTGSAWYTRRACREVTTRVPGTQSVRVPLSAQGLHGGRVGPFGETRKCEVPERVLVRVRAVFTRETRWAPNPDFAYLMRAPGTVREGYVAVRAERTNRPLAFAAITQTTARLHVARHCWQD